MPARARKRAVAAVAPTGMRPLPFRTLPSVAAARLRGARAAAVRLAVVAVVCAVVSAAASAVVGTAPSLSGAFGLPGPAASIAVAAPAPSAAVELQRDVFRIAGQLRCPVCVSESVAQSNAAVSIEMRDQIQAQLEAGRSEDEILASFQARYGDWILLEPPRRGIHLVVWLLPAIAAAFGVAVLAVLVRRWVRKGAEPLDDVDPDELARVRAELAAPRGASEADAT